MFLNVVNLLSGTVAITVESGFPERVLKMCIRDRFTFTVIQDSSGISIKI